MNNKATIEYGRCIARACRYRNRSHCGPSPKRGNWWRWQMRIWARTAIVILQTMGDPR